MIYNEEIGFEKEQTWSYKCLPLWTLDENNKCQCLVLITIVQVQYK